MWSPLYPCCVMLLTQLHCSLASSGSSMGQMWTTDQYLKGSVLSTSSSIDFSSSSKNGCALRCLSRATCSVFFYLEAVSTCRLCAKDTCTESDLQSGNGIFYRKDVWSRCPDELGYIYYKSQLCYRIPHDKLLWIHAEAYCRLQGGHTAIIDSDTEMTLFEEFVKQQRSMYMQQGVTYNVFWVGGRKEGSQFLWRNVRPALSGQQRAYFYKDNAIKKSRSIAQAFVCEIDLIA